MGAGDLISAASIIVGFGVTVIMFRVERELHVQEELEERTWLAWADSLTLSSVFITVLGVILPLLAEPAESSRVLAFTAAVCAAAFVLQAAYIPAILAHYRIALGANRSGLRERGEPHERRIVVVAVLLAIVAFGATLTVRLSAI